MTTELGTELGTTLGTMLASMEVAGSPVFDASKLYALAGLGNSIGYLTAAGGGEVGDAAGFGGATIYTLDTLLPSAGNTGSLQGNYVFPTSGWAQQFTNPGASTTLNAVVINGAGGNVSAPSRTMLASDLGKVGVSAIQHTGTMLRSYADDGREIGTGSAIVGYTPSANPHRIGNRTTGGNTYGSELGWVTWRGTPTQPQIQALFAAVRTLGDFPSKAVIEALIGPARFGVRGFTAANYLASAAGDGIAGVASGFYAMVRVMTDALTGDMVIFGRDNLTNAGWRIGRTNAAISARFTSGLPAQVATAAAPVQLNHVMHVTAVHTGTAIQLYVDGLQVGQDVAITGFTPHTGATVVGTLGAYPANNMSVYDAAGGHYVPTPAEILQSAQASAAAGALVPIPGKVDHIWQFNADITANGGALPTSFADRAPGGSHALTTTGTPVVTSYGGVVTHRWSLRDVLAAANAAVADGSAAPAILPDSVTNAANDQMTKQGAPVVRRIDPGAYPRTSYGALGFAMAAGYVGAVGAGLTGDAAGFWGALLWRLSAISANPQSLAIYGNASGSHWAVQIVTSGLRLGIRHNGAHPSTGTNAAISSVVALTAADVGVTEPLVWNFDGGTFRLYRRNAMIAEITGISYSPNLAGVALGLGNTAPGLNQPAEASIFQLVGGNLAGGLSMQQIADLFAAHTRTGSILGVVPAHDAYDLTKDITANGGPQNGMPPQVLDRVGTDHLARRGTVIVDRGGLEDFTGRWLQTSTAAAGLPGAASGWYVETLVRSEISPTSNQYVFSNTGASTNGLSIRSFAGSVNYRATWADTTASYNVDATAATSGITAGGLTHLCAVYDGTVARLYANGALVGTSAAFVYNPGNQPTKLGALYQQASTTANQDVASHYGASGGNYVPTAGEISAASAYALANAKLQGIAGKVDRRWSIPDDVASAGGGVPAYIVDRAGTDNVMSFAGAQLEVAQRTERLFAYETTPILYGSQAPAAVPGPDFWETATLLGETNGNSFWAAAFFQVLSQSVANQARDLLSSSSTTTQTGFSLRSNTLNTQLQFVAFDNALNPRVSPGAAVAASDVGKLQLYIAVYDQPALRLRSYFKRAEVLTGTSVPGYAPNIVNGFRIGQRFGTQLSNADGLAIYGVAAGLGLPSLAEIQAMYDSTMATERIAAIPGKTSFRIDMTADAVGGALPSTLVNREGAGFTFTKNGSPGTQAQYARAFGW